MENMELIIQDNRQIGVVIPVQALCDKAAAHQVTDLTSYEAASLTAKEVKGLIKQVKEAQDNYLKPLKVEILKVQGYFAPYLGGLTEAETRLKNIRMMYDSEQQRIRDAQQRALEARLRAEAQLEAEKAALAALRAGNEAKAETILELAEQEVLAVPQLAPVKPMKGAGMSYRDNWKWDCVDISLVPREYFKLVLDEDKITAQVKADKDKCNISGIAVRNDRIPTQRY